MKLLAALGRFCYDLVVGDDWKIAVAVVTALAATGVLVARETLPDHALAVVGAGLILLSFTISFVIDVRSRR